MSQDMVLCHVMDCSDTQKCLEDQVNLTEFSLTNKTNFGSGRCYPNKSAETRSMFLLNMF